MADDVTLPGTGDVVAADEIAGVKYQRMKLSLGAEGEAQDLDSGQQLAENSIPVTLTALEEALFGALTESAPGTDTASSGLNGRLQRVAQRITSLIALLPAALGAGGGVKVDGSGTPLPVSGTFYQVTQPVSLADGVDVTQGAKTDARSTATDGTAITLMQVLKEISYMLQNPASQAVTGTFWQATQPVSLASLPALAAGEAHVGQVQTWTGFVQVTLSLDTSGAYAVNEVLADTQEVAGAVRSAAGSSVLESLTVIDEDDQGQGLTLYFFRTNVSLGTENSAPSISDANAREYLGKVVITANDFEDLGGVRVASRTGIGMLCQAGAASTSIYVAALSNGTGTYSASGIRLNLGFI